jgi:hypothetical protein
VNEYNTEGLGSLAFPTLFPDGSGDPFVRQAVPVRLAEHLKVLLWYYDENTGYRFAKHYSFVFWAYDVLIRRRIRDQYRVAARRQPGIYENLTLERVRELATENEGRALVNVLCKYAANITGSAAYMRDRRTDPSSSR